MLAGLMLSASSCSSWLSEDDAPVMSYDYYETEAGVNAAITAAYGFLRWGVGGERFDVLTELGTDLFTEGEDGSNRESYNKYATQLNPDDGILYEMWENHYKGISDANIAMQKIRDLFSNRVLLSGLIGWGAAQVLKTIIYALMHHTVDLTRIFGDGGMPSGHSATVCAVATSAGIIYGLDSFPFAISVIVAIIVMHDAMGVRLETGKQAKLLNEFIDLFAKLEQPLSDQEKLKELVGHTPLQVCMGGLLGILTGVLCNLGG